jgi:hypothetical protein
MTDGASRNNREGLNDKQNQALSHYFNQNQMKKKAYICIAKGNKNK